MMDWLINLVLGQIHPVVWVCFGIAAIGIAWHWLGWKGMAGVALGVSHLMMWLWGWRERNKGLGHVIPKDHKLIGRYTPPPVKKRRTLMDILRGD